MSLAAISRYVIQNEVMGQDKHKEIQRLHVY